MLDDSSFRVELLDRGVTRPLPGVAQSLQLLPLGWTHAATSTDDGVCFAHVRVGESPKDLICDKAVYLLIEDASSAPPTATPTSSATPTTTPSSIEATLIVQLKDMMTLRETSFRSKVARAADIFDMLREISADEKLFAEVDEEMTEAFIESVGGGVAGSLDVKPEHLLLQEAQLKEEEAFIALERESQTRRIAAAQQQQLQLDAQNRYEQQLLQQLQHLSKEQREQLAILAQTDETMKTEPTSPPEASEAEAAVPQGLDILAGLQQALAANLLDGGGVDSAFDDAAFLGADSILAQPPVLQDSKRLRLESQSQANLTSDSNADDDCPPLFAAQLSHSQSNFAWTPQQQLQQFQQQQQQQQRLCSAETSPSASLLGDARRDGAAFLGFENQDSFSDSMDLETGAAAAAAASAAVPSTSSKTSAPSTSSSAPAETERPHKCIVCGRGFKTKAHHRDHMRLHSNVCEFKCPVCHREFKQKSCFTHHLSRVHKNDGPFGCAICGLVFERVHDLARHIPQAHRSDPGVCGYMDDTPVKKEPVASGMKVTGSGGCGGGGGGGKVGEPSTSGVSKSPSSSKSQSKSQADGAFGSGSGGSSGGAVAVGVVASVNSGKTYKKSAKSKNSSSSSSSSSSSKTWTQQQPPPAAAETRTPEEIQRQNLLTLERLLLSPEGMAAAAALSGDVAAAAAALSSAADVSQHPPTPEEAQVLRQQAMAIFQQQQMQQLQQQTVEKQRMERELYEETRPGNLPSMSTFVSVAGGGGGGGSGVLSSTRLSTSMSSESSTSSDILTGSNNNNNNNAPGASQNNNASAAVQSDAAKLSFGGDNILDDDEDDAASPDSERFEESSVVSKDDDNDAVGSGVLGAVHQTGAPRPSSTVYDLECKSCELTFKSSATFESHSKTVHGNDRPYKCKMCSNSFKRKHHLVEHARLHSGKRGFKCNICGKEFKQRCTLTHHTRTHSMHSCPVCHKKFNGDFFLMKHMTVYNHLTPEMLVGVGGGAVDNDVDPPKSDSFSTTDPLIANGGAAIDPDPDSDEGFKNGESSSSSMDSPKDPFDCVSSLRAAFNGGLDNLSVQEFLTSAVGVSNVQDFLTTAFTSDGSLKQPLTPSQLLTASQLMTSAQQLICAPLFEEEIVGAVGGGAGGGGIAASAAAVRPNVTTESVPIEVTPIEVMSRVGDD